jgi:hypothetical protein
VEVKAMSNSLSYPCFTENTDHVGNSGKTITYKARHAYGNTPHPGRGIYPELVDVGHTQTARCFPTSVTVVAEETGVCMNESALMRPSLRGG